MSNLKTLFKEIKDVFVQEGVDLNTVENKKEVEVIETPKEDDTQDVVEKETEQKFEDVVLADGSVAQIEPDVTVGASVVVEIDGELIAAPDGTHELADGRLITTEGGVIVEVVGNVSDTGEAIVETPVVEEVLQTEQTQAKKIVESIIKEKHFATMESVELLIEENKKLKQDLVKLDEGFCRLLSLTEMLVEEPTKEPIKNSNKGYAKIFRKDKKRDIIDVLKEKNIIN